MEQKLVLDLSGNDRKMRKKAFHVASGFPGVYSVKQIEKEKKNLEVLGNGMDPVKLVIKLKRKLSGRRYYILKDYGPFNVTVESMGPLKTEEDKKKSPVKYLPYYSQLYSF